MTSVDPYSVDFASLRILKLVHAHQSFSKAADSLGANQSTISYAIARLREVFHDPLFVRQGGGIVATERCNEIVAETPGFLGFFKVDAKAPVAGTIQSVSTVTGQVTRVSMFIISPALASGSYR